jgi:DNA-binding CsgD family transcriptional regulator
MAKASVVEDLERLQGHASVTDLMKAVDLQARAAGFEHWMYALDLPAPGEHRRQYILSGYPGAWVTHYFEKGYLQIDPVIAHCRTHATPYVWPTSGESRELVDDTARGMFDEVGDFGLRSGLSIPIHGLGCAWGLVSLATSRALGAKDMQRQSAKMHLFAHCLHEAAQQHVHGTIPVDMPRLTPRELECLRWAAVGKTSWEIGMLLQIAERTAVFHLQNAMSKLGTMSRQAAVVRAISLRLISL